MNLLYFSFMLGLPLAKMYAGLAEVMETFRQVLLYGNLELRKHSFQCFHNGFRIVVGLSFGKLLEGCIQRFHLICQGLPHQLHLVEQAAVRVLPADASLDRSQCRLCRIDNGFHIQGLQIFQGGFSLCFPCTSLARPPIRNTQRKPANHACNRSYESGLQPLQKNGNACGNVLNIEAHQTH